MAQPPSRLIKHEPAIRAALAAGMTRTAIARDLGVPVTTLKAHIDRMALPPAPDPEPDGGARTVESSDPAEWGDIRKLLEANGLDVDQWVVGPSVVNTWGELADGVMRTNSQLKVNIMPSLGLLLPARTDGWIAPEPAPSDPDDGDPTLVAFFGDQHAPFHDEGLHRAACQWLDEYQPDRLLLVGDLMDYDAVSRHPSDPEHSATLQSCVDAGYSLVRAYREAAPNAQITALDGNHEERLRASILKHISSLYRLRPGALAGEEEPQALLSTRNLLRLDELKVEWVDPKGSYEHAQVKVSPELAARHGWIAKKGSGSSALATIDHLRHSCVIGHTHRQSIVHHTAHDIDGEPHTLLGAETGTMSQVRGGHGYAVAPDWQQGFATATVWPDGRFKLDLATYVDGTLLWRDWRCTP